MTAYLERVHRERDALARSPPGTYAGGSLQMPSLKPVGHQSTNWIVFFVLMLATAAWTSLGITSPRNRRQQATAKSMRKSEETDGNLPYCICPPWGRISPSGSRSQSTTGSCLEPSFARVPPSQPKGEGHRWQEGSGCGGI